VSHSYRFIRSLPILACLAFTTITPLLQSQTREETSLWDSVKDSKDAEDYKAYLDKYPDGVYAPIAKRRVAQLGTHPVQQTPAVKPGMAAESTAAQGTSKPHSGAPVTMTECEGTNNCATWTFLGTQGNGQWPSGEVANLSVEHFDASMVVIRRADSTGPSAGLTAVYRGTRNGNRVGGEFTSSWPGHWNNMSGNWYATIGKSSQSPPSLMRVCDPDYSCMTLTWNNGHYDGVGNGGWTGTFTVESFSPDSVIMHRVDISRSNYSYVYTGKISSQGNSILNGVWEGDQGTREPGKLGHFVATWGTAFQENPAAKKQGPAPVYVARPTVCYPWFFTVVCE